MLRGATPCYVLGWIYRIIAKECGPRLALLHIESCVAEQAIKKAGSRSGRGNRDTSVMSGLNRRLTQARKCVRYSPATSWVSVNVRCLLALHHRNLPSFGGQFNIRVWGSLRQSEWHPVARKWFIGPAAGFVDSKTAPCFLTGAGFMCPTVWSRALLILREWSRPIRPRTASWLVGPLTRIGGRSMSWCGDIKGRQSRFRTGCWVTATMPSR